MEEPTAPSYSTSPMGSPMLPSPMPSPAVPSRAPSPATSSPMVSSPLHSPKISSPIHSPAVLSPMQSPSVSSPLTSSVLHTPMTTPITSPIPSPMPTPMISMFGMQSPLPSPMIGSPIPNSPVADGHGYGLRQRTKICYTECEQGSPMSVVGIGDHQLVSNGVQTDTDLTHDDEEEKLTLPQEIWEQLQNLHKTLIQATHKMKRDSISQEIQNFYKKHLRNPLPS